MREIEITVKQTTVRRMLADYLQMRSACICRDEGGQLFCLSRETQGQLAQILADFVFGPWEKARLEAMIEDCEAPLSVQEQQQIKLVAGELAEADGYQWSLFAGRQRNQYLAPIIVDYLQQGRLDLDGLLRFSLVGYEEFLRAIFLLALDDVAQLREDQRYWRLLQQVMKEHCASTTAWHLFLSQASYNLLREEAGRLRFCEGGRLAEQSAMVISSVLQAAPRRLVVHGQDLTDGALVEQLQQILGERMVFCTGCPLCCH